jgi:hypothetical protein
VGYFGEKPEHSGENRKMNKPAVIPPLLLLLIIAGNAFALGERDAKPRKVEVSGTVRMVGNSPMNSLVISNENRDWYIEPKEEKKLMPFQQQAVTVKAQEYYYDRTFADGSSAGRQYFLKKIVIVTPKRSA